MSFLQPLQTPPAAAVLIGEQERERRGILNRSGFSRDQSKYWSMIRSSEWVQPLPSPSLPTLDNPPSPHPSFLSTHPHQSSRTCRQRCPPLALHCQRMMQQRHRRCPPPCTEGGGVTGAKYACTLISGSWACGIKRHIHQVSQKFTPTPHQHECNLFRVFKDLSESYFFWRELKIKHTSSITHKKTIRCHGLHVFLIHRWLKVDWL